ncbi:MAG: XrtA-associated tyrosine autokinase [Gammaproteobacteria bacterium]
MSIIEKALQKSANRSPRPAPPLDDSPDDSPDDLAQFPAPAPAPDHEPAHAAEPEPPPTSLLADFGPDELSEVSDVFDELIEQRPQASDRATALDSPGAASRPAQPHIAQQTVAAPRSGVSTTPGLSERLDLPSAGTGQSVEIDFKKLATLGLITPDTLDSETAEEHRVIKRPLLRKVAEGAAQAGVYNNLILVTSSVPGEGKTFTSVNLAISMAMELDHTVLLVDTDVARSGVANVLGISYEHGLTDYLRNEESDLGKLLVKTNIPNLTVLPVGKSYANTTELLSSQEMLRLRDELATRYRDRIVIFDSPPLLAVSGTSVLTEIVGQIVLVVEAVSTSKGALRDALRLLANVPESRIGIVLNKSRETTHKSYRYGYYGNEAGAQR